MFPDSPYAVPLGSFRNPVTPPGIDPDAEPLCTVQINETWIPYVIGCLKQLLLQATWNTGNDANALALVQQRVFNLIDLFNCGAAGVSFDCIGDLAVTSNPFSVWSLGCVGAYSGGLGYTSTEGVCGGAIYQGTDCRIDFGFGVILTHLKIAYDLIKDPLHPYGGRPMVFFQRLPLGDFIGAPLNGDVTVNGSNIIYEVDVTGMSTQILRVFVGAGASTFGGPISGLATIRGIELRGVSVSGTPC